MDNNSDNRQLAVAVGTFDGVHLGHQSLLACLKNAAAKRGLEAAVVTFGCHPLATLSPGREPSSLSTPRLKERLLRQCGVSEVVTLDFDAGLASLTASRFLEMLASKYGVRHLVLGFNTSMGSDRVSRIDDFRRITSALGMSVEVAPELGHGISSSAIRRAIAAGDVAKAAEMLGRPYRLEGRVVHGRQLGRKLGWPTANMEPEPSSQTMPGRGVYACRAYIDGDVRCYPAMVNVGKRPTVDGAEAMISVEAHILDLDADLYGRRMTLDFIRRLRDERRFDNVGLLAAQLSADAEMAREAVESETARCR